MRITRHQPALFALGLGLGALLISGFHALLPEPPNQTIAEAMAKDPRCQLVLNPETPTGIPPGVSHRKGL